MALCNGGGALDDNVVLYIASFGSPEDLLRLGLTCRRLGSLCGWRRTARDTKRHKSAPREWSLVEEAARCLSDQSMTEDERACLPLREGQGWMELYHELLLLRRPLTLMVDELQHTICRGDIIANDDKSEVHVAKHCTENSHHRTAVSEQVMRSGRHYASFAMSGRGTMVSVGIFRSPSPGRRKIKSFYGLEGITGDFWSYGDVWRHDDRYMVRSIHYEGRHGFRENDTVGLLLDLNDPLQGTLTLYKNGTRLALLTDNLVGQYCWGVAVCNREAGTSVKIRRGSVPE